MEQLAAVLTDLTRFQQDQQHQLEESQRQQEERRQQEEELTRQQNETNQEQVRIMHEQHMEQMKAALKEDQNSTTLEDRTLPR